MAPPPGLLPDTAIAAAISGTNVNVYYQYTNKAIVELRYRHGKWKLSGKMPVDPSQGGDAKLFTPLAAYIEDTDDDDDEWHIYYLNNENVIQEQFWDGNKWEIGSLSTQYITTAHFSKLAVKQGDDKTYVYYQDDDGNIRFVFCQDGKWTSDKDIGSLGPGALYGTSLATADTLVFDQLETLAIQETGSGGPRMLSISGPQPSPHTQLSSTADADSFKYIFYTTNSSKLGGVHYNLYTGSTDYHEIGEITPKSKTAAVSSGQVSDGDPELIQVFCQVPGENAIFEYRYVASRGWSKVGKISG